jgi:hypothetical protein
MAFKGESKTSNAGRAAYFTRRKSALTAQRNKRLAQERHGKAVRARQFKLGDRHDKAQAHGQAVCPMPGRMRALNRLASGKTRSGEREQVMSHFGIQEEELRLHRVYLANRQEAIREIASGLVVDKKEAAALKASCNFEQHMLLAEMKKIGW